MFELSLHILDLVQNSITAGAKLVVIIITIDRTQDQLIITLTDDGRGMSPELLNRVTSPFSTTRTTRKVGLGIPMFKQLAEQCEGSFDIKSEEGKGTTLTARFRASNVDLPPLGDLSGTMQSLILGAPDTPDFVLDYRNGKGHFVFDTRDIRKAIGGLSLNEPDILDWIGQYLNEGFAEAGKAAGHEQNEIFSEV